MWRAASWVRWIKLKEDDEVVEVSIVWESAKYVFVATENGMWKISDLDEYRDQNRWGSWVKAMAVTAKTWKVIWAMILNELDKAECDLLLMSKSGQTIRLPLKWIRVTSRVTQWVILTKIRGEDDVIVRASLMHATDENTDIQTDNIDLLEE